MSQSLLTSNTGQQTWYGDPKDKRRAGGGDDDEEEGLLDVKETTRLIDKKNPDGNSRPLSVFTGKLIYELFLQDGANWNDAHLHPKTNPKCAPERRFARHRNYYIYLLNEFRHWWKTSRLLVRVSGGYEYCIDKNNWLAMGLYKVSRHRQAKKALKSVKGIGRGGPSRDFLANVQPFTRSIRIILAVARGWEAKVDNRFMEVLLAEAL
jgi:hypothetical protein